VGQTVTALVRRRWTRPDLAAGVVILVILAGCFLLTLGHGARDVPSQADHRDDGGAGDRSHN
jgi:hypothetical protein